MDAADAASPALAAVAELVGTAALRATGAGMDLPGVVDAAGMDAVVSGAAVCAGRARGVGGRGVTAVCRIGAGAALGGRGAP